MTSTCPGPISIIRESDHYRIWTGQILVTEAVAKCRNLLAPEKLLIPKVCIFTSVWSRGGRVSNYLIKVGKCRLPPEKLACS